MSTESAGLAKKLGYSNVRVFLGGDPAWIKAGKPVYASNDFVAKGNIVLLDLRSVEASAAGRIPRAVSLPYGELEDGMDNIPQKAPVVLYGDDAMEAYADLMGEGFKKVSLVSGGIEGWTKSGGTLEQGPVLTEINWKRQLGKGEVGRADFEKAIGGGGDAVILDVRTPDEAASGGFKGAVVIPLDQLGKRMGEVPKGKKIYAHCTTGARAEMAVKELKKGGYDAYFFMADIDCKGEECKISD